MNRRLSRAAGCFGGCLVAWLIVCSGPSDGRRTLQAAAPDRIGYTPARLGTRSTPDLPWIPQPLITAVGTIERFDQQRLTLRPVDGEAVVELAADQLLWIEPGWDDPDAVAGMAAYRAGDYAEAIPRLLAALKQRPAVWRQQWLSVRMAIAAFEAGRYPAVLELTAQLDRIGLPAVMVGQLPFAWHGPARDPQRAAAARGQLTAAEPLVQLMAASYLLGGSEGAAADATLARLSQEGERPLVARMADALRWRQSPPAQTRARFPQWQEKLGRLPIAVRWGPMMVIADRWQAAAEPEKALEWWLAAGLLAPQRNHPAAHRAQQQAAGLLEQLGRSPERLPAAE